MPLFEQSFVPPPIPEISSRRKADEDDSIYLAALKNLEPLLAESEKKRWALELEAELTIDQQFAAWRARRKANNA